MTEISHDERPTLVLGARLTDGDQRALGRPPRNFGDYAARVAATGIWNPPADR